MAFEKEQLTAAAREIAKRKAEMKEAKETREQQLESALKEGKPEAAQQFAEEEAERIKKEADKQAKEEVRRVEDKGGTEEQINEAEQLGNELGEAIDEEVNKFLTEVGTEREEVIPETVPEREEATEEQIDPLMRVNFTAIEEENKPLIDRMSEAAQRLVYSLYEKARMNTIDKIKVAFNNKLYDWHDSRSLNLSSQLNEVNEQIRNLEERISSQEKAYSLLEKRFAKYLPIGRSGELEKERQQIEKRIENLKNRRDKLQSRLEDRNNKKAVFDNGRKYIIEDVTDRIKEQLDPYKKRIDNLQESKETLDREIDIFRRDKEGHMKDIKKLEEELKSIPSRTIRRQIREIINSIRAEIKISDREIKSRMRDRANIEKRLAKINSKANYWKDLANNFARVSQRNVIYPEIGTRERVEVDISRREISVRPREENAEQYVYEENPFGESREEEKNFSPYNYVKTWNTYNRSRFPIDWKTFKNMLGKPEEKMPANQLGGLIEAYFSYLESQGLSKILTSRDRRCLTNAIRYFNRTYL